MYFEEGLGIDTTQILPRYYPEKAKEKPDKSQIRTEEKPVKK
ncbi:MAG: hypothetical protein VB074_01955 [Proteiniphilum sp.]|jgi:hypothetical protein|nr:hypothetical protein [Proteiniphilum sp.]MEA5126925.1 hypothetical protein [Proteiniphilum sp.]